MPRATPSWSAGNSRYPSGRTTYVYDAHGRTTSESHLVDDQGHTAVTTYGDYGDFPDAGRTTQMAVALSATSTPVDLVTVRTFDDFGRPLTEETDPAGVTVSRRSYDLSGEELDNTDAVGMTTHHRYDCLGHEIETSDTAGDSWARWTRRVDPTGLVLSQTSYVTSSGAAVPAGTVVHVYDGSGN